MLPLAGTISPLACIVPALLPVWLGIAPGAFLVSSGTTRRAGLRGLVCDYDEQGGVLQRLERVRHGGP
jgi:hypothetical protein